MSILFDNPPPAIGCGDPGDPIDFGCLFAGAQSFQRTPTVTGNRRLVCFSEWAKRVEISTFQMLFGRTEAASENSDYLQVTLSNDKLKVDIQTGLVSQGEHQTKAVYRDVSGWSHRHIVIDTDNPVASERIRITIDGIRQPVDILTAVTLGSNLWVNIAGIPFFVGVNGGFGSTNLHRKEYVAETAWFDGFAPDATEFGYFNAYGDWVPKAFSGKGEGSAVYGVNGAHLDFADPLDLGKDVSGNGNHFTASGLTVDNQVTDTPTNNFCVLNPLVPSGSSSLSSGNLRIASSGPGGTYGTLRVTRGVYKIEACFNTALDFSHVGWQDAASGRILGGTGMVNTYLRSDGDVFVDGVIVANVGQIAAGSYIGVRLDLEAGKVSYFRNGDPLSGPHAISLAEGWAPMVTVGPSSGVTIDLNCGQKPFVYEIDPDALTVCTANGACPEILNPDDYFTVRLSNGGADITDLPWDPTIGKTFHMAKRLDGVSNFRVSCTVLGDNLAINCNVGGAEVASSLAFTAGGASVGVDAEYQGQVLHQFWRASPKAGADFVVVEHVNGTPTVFAQATGGLFDYAEVYPLSGGNTRVFHRDMAAGGYLILNDKGTGTDAGWLTRTANTGTLGAQMASGRYLIRMHRIVPQFCAVTSGKGIGVVDGMFVPMDFEPRIFVGKDASDGLYNWALYCSDIASGNPVSDALRFNLDTAVVSAFPVDMNSNGVKARNADNFINKLNATYRCIAWAKTPGKFARAR